MIYEEFINLANNIHNYKYSYPKQEFKNLYTKIKIICPKHGMFEQRPNTHLKGHGCKKCFIETDTLRKYMYQEQFIKRCKQLFPNYDYSKTIYKGTHYKVNVICPKHGLFTAWASNLLAGHGCSKCYSRPSTKESFIEAAIKIHGNKYDYSKVEYRNNNTKVEIICPKHGSFWSTPGNHLSGKGCLKCQSSKGEKRIREILKEKDINFIEQKRFKDCKFKNPLPFDFYLPEYNICIEYQGEQHYLPIKRGKQSLKEAILKLQYVQNNDKIKREYCIKNNIKLLEITYKDDIQAVLNNIKSTRKINDTYPFSC